MDLSSVPVVKNNLNIQHGGRLNMLEEPILLHHKISQFFDFQDVCFRHLGLLKWKFSETSFSISKPNFMEIDHSATKISIDFSHFQVKCKTSMDDRA